MNKTIKRAISLLAVMAMSVTIFSGLMVSAEEIVLAEGKKYSVTVAAWHATNDEASAGMTPYLETSAVVEKADSKSYVYFTTLKSDEIDYVEDGTSNEVLTAVKEDETAKTKTYKMEITSVDVMAMVNLKPLSPMAPKVSFRIKFDTATLVDITETTQLTDGKTYEVKIEALKEDLSGPSMVDNYIVKDAKVEAKDGKIYAYVTIESTDIQKGLKVKAGDDYVLASTADRDDAKKTIVYKFEVTDIDAVLPSKITITPPGMPEMEPSFMFKFDVSNIKETTAFAKTSKNGWVTSNKKTYYYINNVMQKNKLIVVNKKTYILNKSGVKLAGTKIVTLGKKKYYIKKDVMQKGTKWVTVSNKSYYLKKNVVQVNKIIKKGKKSYIVNANGARLTGKAGGVRMVTFKGKKYCIKKNYIRKSCKFTYKGKKYRANKNGIVKRIKK